MIVRRFKINMIPGGKMAEVALSQYDSDATLEFELYASDGTFVVESGTTAVFRGSKPDKNGISVAAELESIIDPETGKNIYLATVDVIPQMTAVAGRSLYELSLQKGGEELNTANFILDIERAPLDADTLPSESVIRELVDVIDKADEIMAAAEAVTTAIDDTLTQQGKAADAKKVGDEIADIRADLSELGPGLSDEAKAALLACFNHVVWTDENGQDYYDALEDALYNSVSLRSITANYSPAGHVIYPYDILDSLKDYLIVTANYSDGTTQIVTDYTLSGNFNSPDSVITVAYQNRIAQVHVDVTIDADLAYYVTRGTELNGVDSGFNTEYVPSDTNKAVTIICDFTDTSIVNRARSMSVVYNANNSSGYAALVVSSASGSDFVKQYAINAHGAGSRKLGNLTNASHRMRFAYTHAANSNYVYGSLYVDETTVCENVEMSANYITDSTPLYVGRRPSGGYLAEGVINLFNIYNRVLTQSEIKNLLEVS